LFSTHTGTLVVDAAGTDNISATGGSAIDVTNAATLAFDDVDSTNSDLDGINLVNFGTGTFTALSGDITEAAGIAFDLAGGSGTVTYPGNINDGTGASAEITGRTGGTVTLSGPINDSNDAGGRITVSGSSGGTTTISGTTKTLNTGASQALTFETSNGHTLNITGGNLDIDTTSGNGVFADDARAITITGTNNTISTTTGTALTITNTDIGNTGATFQSIAQNGGGTAIVLDDTGAGAFTVTGAGTTDGTGGTIENIAAADAVTLNNTDGVVTLENMIIENIGSTAGASNTISGNGLSIVNGSLIEQTNRFHVAGVGDADNEEWFASWGSRELSR
jgi:hypothetical protein